MSAKELGQIHVLNDVTPIAATTSGVTRKYDLAGMATDKLQRLIRQGQYFKLCGIDISANAAGAALASQEVSVSGYFRYYSPTKGRCAAFRHAFKAMADQMKIQGIAMRNNKLYDFRVALSDNITTLPLTRNQATLDGTNGLCLNNGSIAGASVFGVYNKSVVPTSTATAPADLFDEGFNTLLQGGVGMTDFVLNDSDIYTGNENYADETYDRIPFQVHFGNGNATAFQFRPDPALYVAILTGNLEMVVEDVTMTGGLAACDLEISFMVSGWKSIMGSPEKKRRGRRSSKKKKA